MLLLNTFRIIQAFSSGAPAGGECADAEDPEPAGPPASPTPDTGTARSCYWAQVPGWICLKLRKPTESFGTLKL